MRDIAKLVSAFEKRTLPKSEWTHNAHLAVAFYYLKNYSLFQAICLLRTNIIMYNVSVGGTNSFTEGYHETLTLFWAKVIVYYIQENPTHTFYQFLVSPTANNRFPFEYYSKERLFSIKARASWITPDLKQMDF